MGNNKSWGLGLSLFGFTVYGKDMSGNWDFFLLLVTWPFDGRALLQVGTDKVSGIWFGALWLAPRWFPWKDGDNANS
jgi:hypothetical protein